MYFGVKKLKNPTAMPYMKHPQKKRMGPPLYGLARIMPKLTHIMKLLKRIPLSLPIKSDIGAAPNDPTTAPRIKIP